MTVICEQESAAAVAVKLLAQLADARDHLARREGIEVDVAGMAVAPGFINMMCWANESLIEDGYMDDDGPYTFFDVLRGALRKVFDPLEGVRGYLFTGELRDSW